MKYIIIVSLVLAGCSTAYQPKGFSGGFSQTQLAPDTFTVSFRGNSYTSNEKVTDFVLLRSAEIALENGYSHFVLMDSQDTSHTKTVPVYQNTQTTGTVTTTGNTSYINATTTGGPKTQQFFKPGQQVMIKLIPEPTNNTFDAAFLKNSISSKYELE